MENDNKNFGWVYVLTNKAIPNLVKIGFTRNDPKKRARQLAREGLPYPYIVEYAVFVKNPQYIERKTHSF